MGLSAAKQTVQGVKQVPTGNYRNRRQKMGLKNATVNKNDEICLSETKQSINIFS